MSLAAANRCVSRKEKTLRRKVPYARIDLALPYTTISPCSGGERQTIAKLHETARHGAFELLRVISWIALLLLLLLTTLQQPA